jgi:hypothetical protein
MALNLDRWTALKRCQLAPCSQNKTGAACPGFHFSLEAQRFLKAAQAKFASANFQFARLLRKVSTNLGRILR